jgi:arylsulfatase A-like enzyme
MPARKTETSPNIILINCDDLGYGDLGCYGSDHHATPNIDRLAAEGLRMTDFYMASPVCSPSRGAMMTGCYPPRIGFGKFEGCIVLFPGQGVGLNHEEKTVASILKDAGYATKIVGKWHCGDQPEFLPTRHGFDSYFGLPYSNDMGRQVRNDGRPQAPPLPLLRDEEVVQQQPDQAGLTERYTEECVRFLRENRNGPFFLYFAHMHVHMPLYAPQRFLESSRNGRYGAAVECIDWSVGVLLHELKALGIDENTLVVFTSDNGSIVWGGGSNDPLRGRKGQTWEGGLRVPCLMRWPGRIPAGSVCREVATAMDFLPTFAALAGTSAPSDRILDGKDIRPLLFDEDGAQSPHETFFYYLQNFLCAVRCGKWKLHVKQSGVKKDVWEWYAKETLELYDLEADIGETTNLAGQHPEIVEQLKQKLQACREDIGDECTNTEGENVRPIGRADNPKPLTEYDENHPYIIAMYDLPDRG